MTAVWYLIIVAAGGGNYVAVPIGSHANCLEQAKLTANPTPMWECPMNSACHNAEPMAYCIKGIKP